MRIYHFDRDRESKKSRRGARLALPLPPRDLIYTLALIEIPARSLARSPARLESSL